MWFRYLCFLAQDEPLDPGDPNTLKGVQFTLNQEVMLVVTVALVVCAAIVLWAVFFRRRRSPDHHQRAIQTSPFSSGDGEPPRERRHRRRHRRRRSRGSHGHRNPTLQETGGLPAARAQDELPGA